MLPPTVWELLNDVFGIGTRLAMTISAFSPSLTRICGCAIDLVSVSLFRKFRTTEGIGPSSQFPFCLIVDRLFSGTDFVPSRKPSVIDLDDRSMPSVVSVLR